MTLIRNIPDTDQLVDKPELQREVISYLLYCKHELQKYADEEDLDSQNFNFLILDAADIPILTDLGTPEETVQINIKSDGHTITIYRIIYPTTVIFIPSEISVQISF